MSTDAPDRGRRIGRYELLREIGRGGMSVVHCARDTVLQRDVALKLLHPHLAGDAGSRERFLREARAAARLRHPCIVEVFDFSAESDAESFLVTELLEGPTLRTLVERHAPVSAEAAALVGIAVCDALSCAHAQSVIHRDVKPDNVLVHRGGVKLTDFGVAHLGDAKSMTVTGQMLGSPAHMAPEQINGGPVDGRTDLFALGTVLYQLGTGRLPFDAETPHALLHSILECAYPDPEVLAPRLGHRFSSILRNCLTRDPANRPADARALRGLLAGFLAEAGFDDPSASLARWLADPAAFDAQLVGRLPDRLAVLGRAALSAGRRSDALGYFNRALAYAPGDARILRAVSGIARRRRIERAVRSAGLVAAVATVTFGLGVGVWTAVRGRTRTAPVVVVAATDASRAPVESTRATPPVAAPSLRPDAGLALAVRLPPRLLRAAASQGPSTRIAPPPERTPAEVRPVHLRIVPEGAFYSIDGSPMREYGPAETKFFDLPVGPHRIRVMGASASCNERTTRVDVTPGPDRMTIRVGLHCGDESTVLRGGEPSATASAP